MDGKTKLLYVVLILLVILSIGAQYYRSIVLQDFMIDGESTGDADSSPSDVVDN